MADTSASESARTVPSVSMMVRRLSGAAWLNWRSSSSGSVMALWASIRVSSSWRVFLAASISRLRNMRTPTTLEMSRAHTTVNRVAPMIRFFTSKASHPKAQGGVPLIRHGFAVPPSPRRGEGSIASQSLPAPPAKEN